jgi:hypothetical protein
MRQYYIHDGVQQVGPLNVDELKEKQIAKSTLVWYEGLTNWTVASEVEELKDFFKVDVPPPAPIIQNTKDDTIDEIRDKSVTKRKHNRLYVGFAAAIIVVIVVLIFIKNNQQSLVASSSTERNSSEANAISDNNSQEDPEEEERRRRNEELTKKNMEYRNNWTNYIGVGRFTYKPSVLGGMESFPFPIVNNTDYIIDEVKVQVSYVKDNGEVYKLEDVVLYNIPANSEKWANAPGSSRGTTVSADIVEVISKKMHFCFPHHNGNPNDPYFCK